MCEYVCANLWFGYGSQIWYGSFCGCSGCMERVSDSEWHIVGLIWALGPEYGSGPTCWAAAFYWNNWYKYINQHQIRYGSLLPIDSIDEEMQFPVLWKRCITYRKCYIKVWCYVSALVILVGAGCNDWGWESYDHKAAEMLSPCTALGLLRAPRNEIVVPRTGVRASD